MMRSPSCAGWSTSSAAPFEGQAKLLGSLSNDVITLRRQIDDASAVALAARNEVADLKKEAPATSIIESVSERLAAIEQSAQRKRRPLVIFLDRSAFPEPTPRCGSAARRG
jgi:hypothetical protein